MAIFTPQEIHFAQDGQTDIKLNHYYMVGANELKVYLNGMLAICGPEGAGDYEEIDNHTIRFHYQLSQDDVIVAEHRIFFDDKKISVIGEKKEGLFQKYYEDKSVQTLLPNQTYKVRFIYDGQEFESSFQTVINPLYSTVRTIREDLGDITLNIPDSRLLYLIYQNSILSQNIASEENLALLESEEKTPFVFKQYVRYRTEMDIMTSIYLTLSGKQEKISKVLGEMEIEKRGEFKLNGIKDVLSDLKIKLKKAERALTGENASSPLRTAVKGGSDSYPLTSPRLTFSTLTTSS